MHGRPGKVLDGQRAAEAAPVAPANRLWQTPPCGGPDRTGFRQVRGRG